MFYPVYHYDQYSVYLSNMLWFSSRLVVSVSDFGTRGSGSIPGVTVSFFPSQFFPRGKNGPAHSFPGEKTDRSVFSPGERFDLSVFSPPSQFFPPMLFFRKRLENDICAIVQLNQIKYHPEIAVL